MLPAIQTMGIIVRHVKKGGIPSTMTPFAHVRKIQQPLSKLPYVIRHVQLSISRLKSVLHVNAFIVVSKLSYHVYF